MSAAQDLVLDPALSAHQSISEWLTGLIAEQRLPQGFKLPAERRFSQALGVSRMTLRQALESLQQDGSILRVVGAKGGSFVAEARVPVDISNLMGLSKQLLKSVHSASSIVISAQTISAEAAVAEALQLPVGEEVHRIHRLRYAGATPVVIEESFLPAGLFPRLLELDLDGSIYELMSSRYSLAPYSSVEELNPVIISEADAKLMEIKADSAVLGVKRTALAKNGQPVEYSRDLIRTDRLEIVVSGRVGDAT